MKKAELKELIKTSILEDYSQNFPDDIKWEFSGEIIDQMDQYNATIGLVGHSESTGKDYAASAEASRGGAGGDWEWMEEDEVEELAEGSEEENYDPDQEQLDDEDEIFMPYDDEGRPLGEVLKRVDVIAEADAIVEAWIANK